MNPKITVIRFWLFSLAFLSGQNAFGENMAQTDVDKGKETQLAVTDLKVLETISDETVTYLTNNGISANNVITDNSNVSYISSTRIILTKGFRVDAGSTFKAKIDDSIVNTTSLSTPSTGLSSKSDNNKSEELSVYPNPASNNVKIDMNSISGEKQIFVFSITGILIQTSITNESEYHLDISDYKSGMYLVYIKNKTGEFQQRLCIE